MRRRHGRGFCSWYLQRREQNRSLLYHTIRANLINNHVPAKLSAMMPRRTDGLCSSGAEFACLKFAWRLISLIGCGVVTYLWLTKDSQSSGLSQHLRTFHAGGIVESVLPDQNIIVISHEPIGSYMGAMTMPFKVRNSEEMRAIQPGDKISFQLSVTDTESWIEQIVKSRSGPTPRRSLAAKPEFGPVPSQKRHPLLEYAFTNELAQPVTLDSFKGQALAITFFFTRCPIPEFCPRLSQNFAEASRRLSQLPHGPTNWHFLSVSFDPEFDSPAVLRAYGEKYRYDPARWSFITGPKEKIAELARLSNVEIAPDEGLFKHNFRTMIIDASGRVQMIFPMGGDLSEAIVSEMLKAANRTTNRA